MRRRLWNELSLDARERDKFSFSDSAEIGSAVVVLFLR
jgi:hypothetical protein